MDPVHPEINEASSLCDWSEFYVEEISLPNAPEALGKEVYVHMIADSDNAEDNSMHTAFLH